jgi:Uma2 family endonuclease
MGVMSATETTGGFTRADLDAMPNDGRRYELLNGTIIVSAAPSPRHQRAVVRMWRLLDASVPDDLEVFVSPLDVALPTLDVLEPDVVVTRKDIITDKDVTGVPELVIEVLSPSSVKRDLSEKLEAFRDAGVPSYWVVDPVDPRLRAWDLQDGEYVEIADVNGDEEWIASAPYAVSIRPGDLVRS